jgi:hypothetical protein
MTQAARPVDYRRFKVADSEFSRLSLSDLVAARDLYHVFLMRHPNLVATAIGRYRIRTEDSWPNDKRRHHGTGVRRLDNSEVRPYSWPCILAFVEKWQNRKDFTDRPSEIVPPTLFLPDSRSVPVCVIEAPKEITTEIAAPRMARPINNIGAGSPIIARVQGNEYLATVGCLVSDGHRVYGLTNRHVTGDAGEVVWSLIENQVERIGRSSSKQLTRLPVSALYPGLSAHNTFVNLDIGLIEIDDLSRWTTDVGKIHQVGQMVDYSGANLSLSLIGCQVCGIGAAGGLIRGEIHGLFYRYKAVGGFEYVADLFIGPRTADNSGARGKNAKRVPPFATLPGDSGTMWMLEPTTASKNGHAQGGTDGQDYLPLAVQWGRNMLYSANRTQPQSYVLATLLSKVCVLLEVDPVRGWNVNQDDTWGALGHFSIAARAPLYLSGRFPKLGKLLANNALIISHDDAALEKGDFKGMGSADFVPMADVPDFFWKPRVGKQGHTRPFEGPNHFADMDQPNPEDKTLLDLTKDDSFIDPDKWQDFYETVDDILTGEPIAPVHRGLLPFRVWQLFDAMVEFASNNEPNKFVCAAGVLTHYLGDSCQPLHISYLHDGDPERHVTHTFTKGKKEGQKETRPLGQGVHSAYEDAMVFAHRAEILAGLKQQPTRVKASEQVATGFEAAKKTIELMRDTFSAIPPDRLVQTYIDVGKGGKAATDALWNVSGKQTISVMRNGAHLVALIWESAWAAGRGETNVTSTAALTQEAAMEIVSDPDFVPSVTVDTIGKLLKRPQQRRLRAISGTGARQSEVDSRRAVPSS